MKKILFLGDSHLSKMASQFRKKNQTDFIIHFIPCPGPTINDIYITQNHLCVYDRNQNYYESFPQSDIFDFYQWYTSVKNQIFSIESSGKINLNNYDAFVLLGFGLLKSEPLLNLLLGDTNLNQPIEKTKNELIKSQAITLHIKLLREILAGLENISSSIFSVPWPNINENSDFACRNNDYINEKLLNLINQMYDSFTIFLLEEFKSTLIKYPENLKNNNGFFTSAAFQNNEKDFNHLSAEGSMIMLDYILYFISQNTH
jgi:hypothetical protein